MRRFIGTSYGDGASSRTTLAARTAEQQKNLELVGTLENELYFMTQRNTHPRANYNATKFAAHQTILLRSEDVGTMGVSPHMYQQEKRAHALPGVRQPELVKHTPHGLCGARLQQPRVANPRKGNFAAVCIKDAVSVDAAANETATAPSRASNFGDPSCTQNSTFESSHT